VGLGAGRDQQGVVGDLVAGARAQHAGAGVDLGHGVHVQLGLVVTGDLGQVEVGRLSEPEGLHDRKWRVCQVATRREEHELDAPAGQPAQRDHRLQRGKPAPGDHDAV
jgi:hypothetical protein